MATIMKEDSDPILVPVVTGNIVLRGLPYSVKERLLVIKRQQGWNSWADMANWVLDNSHRISSSDEVWTDDDVGYIVCRDLPLEVRDRLARLKRLHGWSKWTDMVFFVLADLEMVSDGD